MGPVKDAEICCGAPHENSLHLAWVQELANGTSCIIYAKMDLSQNWAATLNFQQVNGSVGRLTLAATGTGDVLIGWTYQEAANDVPMAGATELPREGEAVSKQLELPSRRLSDPESITVDSQGNLHLIWIDL